MIVNADNGMGTVDIDPDVLNALHEEHEARWDWLESIADVDRQADKDAIEELERVNERLRILLRMRLKWKVMGLLRLDADDADDLVDMGAERYRREVVEGAGGLDRWIEERRR